jgi:hypothetical protein
MELVSDDSPPRVSVDAGGMPRLDGNPIASVVEVVVVGWGTVSPMIDSRVVVGTATVVVGLSSSSFDWSLPPSPQAASSVSVAAASAAVAARRRFTPVRRWPRSSR